MVGVSERHLMTLLFSQFSFECPLILMMRNINPRGLLPSRCCLPQMLCRCINCGVAIFNNLGNLSICEQDIPSAISTSPESW